MTGERSSESRRWPWRTKPAVVPVRIPAPVPVPNRINARQGLAPSASSLQFRSYSPSSWEHRSSSNRPRSTARPSPPPPFPPSPIMSGPSPLPSPATSKPSFCRHPKNRTLPSLSFSLKGSTETSLHNLVARAISQFLLPLIWAPAVTMRAMLLLMPAYGDVMVLGWLTPLLTEMIRK